MGKTSREKGKRGEREFAAFLRDLGLEARRTQQFSGTEGTADVSSSLNGVHLEVKRYKGIAAFRFLEQAERDSHPDDLPVVAMREDRGEWTLMFRAKHLQEMAAKTAAALGMSLATSGSSPPSSRDGTGEDTSDASRSTN
tara:strand:- start:58 stop:477 length:420 start_codon:yes stop_codon:yes gene_type:complete